MNAKLIAISFVLLISSISSLQAQIKILESNHSGLKIKWNIEALDTVVVKDKHNTAVALSFKGQNTVIGENGETALPGYKLFAGVPPAGDITVSVIPQTVVSIPLSAKPILQKYPANEVRQPGLNFSNPWISDPMYRVMKRMRTAGLIIRPVIYDESSGSVRVMTSGVITISFPKDANRSYTAGTSDFEEMLSSLICNYDIAKGWRIRPSLKKKASAGAHPLENNKVYHFTIGDGHSGFNESTTNENGLINIPGSVIRQEFGAAAVSGIRLFASHKGELPIAVPDADSIPDGVLEIPLLRIDHNKNGQVDNDDYFITFVTGASDWIYSNGEYEMKIDRYDDNRHYWLTNGGVGKSVSKHMFDGFSDDTLTIFKEHIQLKRSIELRGKSEGGLDWAWKKLTNSNQTFTQQLTLPGLDSTIPGTIQFDLRLYYANVNTALGDSNWYNTSSYNTYSISDWRDKNITLRIADGAEDTAFVEINKINVTYSRKLDISEHNSLSVFSKSDSGTYTYTLRGFDGNLVYLFRILSDESDISLIDTIRGIVGSTYSWTDTGNCGARYYICKESALLQLPANEPYPVPISVPHSVHDLRNTNNSTDYLIITHRDFVAQAEVLAIHKEKMGFVRPAIVEVSEIYRLFSGGDVDPAAIRNFIAYVRLWNKGSDLDYVLLLGSAHYDFKQYKAIRPVYVPTFYDVIYGDTEVLEDDFFTDTLLALGRIPCETPAEAEAVIKKIKEFEDPTIADYSEWRNRAVFISDDDMQGEKEDVIGHNSSSDMAAEALIEKWKSLDMRKISLFEYALDNAREKPGATRAIINEVNNGAAYINYFGHGGTDVWADEHVLAVNHIQQMVNKGRYPLVSSFSCSVGKFDEPGKTCLSAALVTADGVGAIAAIASSRKSYANSNEILAQNFYSRLSDTLGKPLSIGVMLIEAKLKSSNSGNRTYVLLGDPSLRFVKSIRNIKMEVFGKDNVPLSEIKALQQITIKGDVLNNVGVQDREYGSTSSSPAYVHIGLFNPPHTTSRKDGGENPVSYVLPGTPIFLGKTKVNNGHFEQTIRIPKNIAFNKAGVKLTAYSWREGIDEAGSGYRSDFMFSGSDITDIDDTVGPSITIRPIYDSDNMSSASASFNDKVTSILPLKCEIELYDSSGIDVVGTGPDEGLTMEVKDALSKRSINHKFQFQEGDFRRGVAPIEFEEKSLKVGTYSMIITSRDLLGNLSVQSFEIEIVDERDLKLDHVFNFPNPVRLGKTTRFYFYPSNTLQNWTSDRIRVVIKIYTLSGQPIRVIKDAHNGVTWDCRDQRGIALSPDVYLYQVQAYSSQKRKLVKSKVKKLVIHPPR